MERAAPEDPMTRLFGIIYALVGPTVAGVLIVVALTMNMYDMKTMIYAAVIGFVAALPVAWIVAGKINDA
jgi:hypothetical protein